MAVNRKIGVIDKNKLPLNEKIFLCKRDKTKIKRLSEAFNVKYNTKINTINEITFDIPAVIMQNHRLVDNPSIKMIKHRYLFKIEYGNNEEYFLINEKDKSFSDSNIVTYHAYGLGYELNDKIIRVYEEKSKNLEEHVTHILEETNWKIGYVDSEFAMKYRAYDVLSQTVLQCIYDLGEKFNALIEWDTVNRIINFYKPNSQNKGLKLTENKYLQSMNQVENSEETITRLVPYGMEGLTVNSVNPTGQAYIEDFSYYMFPYKENRMYEKIDIPPSDIDTWDNLQYTESSLLAHDRLAITNNHTSIGGKLHANTQSKNYRFSTNMKPINNTGSMGFFFNYIDENNYHYISYSNDESKESHIQLLKKKNGEEIILNSVHKTNYEKWNPNQDYLLSFEIINNVIKFWIDNHLVMSYENEESFTEGRYGIFLLNNTIEVHNSKLNIKEFSVISSSEHMSDSLCHAILDHKLLIEENQKEFNFLFEKRNTLDGILIERRQELVDLNDELKIILNELDIFNTNNKFSLNPDEVIRDETDEEKKERLEAIRKHNELILNRDNKEDEILAKQNEIINFENEFNENSHEMMQLQIMLASENNFTPKQMHELIDYIIVKEYNNEFITDPNDLFEEAKEVFHKFREPKVQLNIDIIDFLKIVECHCDWDKLALGDIVAVVSERLDIETTAKIIEINHDFDNDSISIVVANEKELTDFEDYAKIISNAQNTSVQVSHDKYKWNLSLENNGAINDIINNKWDAIKNNIVAGYEQLIEIGERGILVKSPDDPNTYLVIQNGMLAITNDNGDSWKHAITSEGIVGERIYGKIIMGVNLAIEDKDGIIRFRGSKGRIYDRNGNEIMKLGLVTEQSESECFGLVLENPITQVKVTDCEGFAITRRTHEPDREWEKIVWIDPLDGTIYSKDMVAERLKIVNNVGNEILNAETGRFDIGFFNRIVTDGKLTAIEKLQIYKELSNIKAYYDSMLNQAKKYSYSNRDDVIDFESQYPERTIQSSNVLMVDTSEMTISYNTLIDYVSKYVSVPPEFDDTLMQRTDDIDRNLFVLRFKNFYDEANKVRNMIEDYLKYSGFQIGKFYNNLVIDSIVGFMAIRDDNKYRTWINATHGLAIQKWENGRWVNKLYGDIDGTLTAEGLVTKNLKIVDGNLGEKIIFDHNDGITINGNNGEQIRLNANEGIAIDVEVDGIKEKRFWIDTDGTLRAKKLIVTPENEDELVMLPDGSYISDLVVKRLRSLNSVVPQDYVHIEDNYLRLLTGNGELNDIKKFELKLEGTGHDGYPLMQWGVGSIEGNDILKMYKDNFGFHMNYKDGFGKNKIIKLTDNDDTGAIQIRTDDGAIKMSAGANASVHIGTDKIEFVFGTNKLVMNLSGIHLN